MTFVETFLFLTKWVHGIAAVAWIGGCIFYLIVLTPLLSKGEIDGAFSRSIAVGFRSLVHFCIATLVITGSVIMFNSLSSQHINTQYIVTLTLKITLSIGMFYLVWRQGKRKLQETPKTGPRTPTFQQRKQNPLRQLVPSGAKAILWLGIITFLLSDLLAIIFLKSVLNN